MRAVIRRMQGHRMRAHRRRRTLGSFDLIDRAEAAGAIDAETALSYRVFATFAILGCRRSITATTPEPRIPDPEYAGRPVRHPIAGGAGHARTVPAPADSIARASGNCRPCRQRPS